MTIEFNMPKGPSLHGNPKFRSMGYEARLRVMSQWATYWAARLDNGGGIMK